MLKLFGKKNKSAFTLTELAVAMLVMTIIVSATIKLTMNKMSKVDSLSYYMAYTTAVDINSNLLTDETCDLSDLAYHSEDYTPAFKYSTAMIDISKLDESIILDTTNNTIREEWDGKVSIGANGALTPAVPTTKVLCEKIVESFNTKESHCSDVNGGLAFRIDKPNDFTYALPKPLVLSNGVKIYFSENFGAIDQLAGAAKEDRYGYVLYIDSNGDSGHNKLYEDVFPFYILASGKTIPAYDPAITAGANSNKHLSLNVVYDDYIDGTRVVKTLMKDTNFKNAACRTGYIVSSKYCVDSSNNVIEKYATCNNKARDCRFTINAPIKLF